MIDLRSDTVTKPTAAMRTAMAEAEVGDDVYGEDPAVNRLEQRAAQILGKEASLFVPTGTMGNTIAIKLHTEHGQELICDSRSHIFNYELGMMSWFCGCTPRPIDSSRGLLEWSQIKQAIRPLGPHWAPTGLVEIENTHNMGGGTVYRLDQLDEIGAGAKQSGLAVHMDGARIFNAAAALGVPVSRIAECADTVMFCLSKGLGAPVGSMLAGSQEAVDRGRLYRKRLGGGMRQAGVLAAAGLIALEEMPNRLREDHANARLLARGLADIPGIQVNVQAVETNIVIFDISETGLDSGTLSGLLKERGVLANGIGPATMRIVTHYDVTTEMCQQAIQVIKELLFAPAGVQAKTSSR
ncbi:MAG TPA: low-specificity L-threonine aldolase [Bryobacteraceae bacterium]|nr:low-specificity L-threonine aldolase [Bryobacteraceae bacterium]